MRAVIQRVSRASVTVEEATVSAIGSGLLILLGIEAVDGEADVEWLAPKIASMRLFEDGEGRMNRSLLDTGGQAIVVSQFTLHASTKKGNRPSFIRAAPPEHSEPLYRHFCEFLSRCLDKEVGRGRFGAMMEVTLTNDGPVTIVIDSRVRQ
ncbi:MAG TPA: D-tyrosyl-tRNA(Tyr) deacylase [Verrucomicrobiales bacterium]|nr:D-tyrosyl-tRNA(Tyr) deacylase [Deltaproteobacteria bacterium]HAT18729.1 D-tyrosyl-tRNA(Tyr) deacylase [Verrucomicrobiales bacterium]